MPCRQPSLVQPRILLREATCLVRNANAQVGKPEIENGIWNALLEFGNGMKIGIAPIGHRIL